VRRDMNGLKIRSGVETIIGGKVFRDVKATGRAAKKGLGGNDGLIMTRLADSEVRGAEN
jgi:hypothetical protein